MSWTEFQIKWATCQPCIKTRLKLGVGLIAAGLLIIVLTITIRKQVQHVSE